jgi:hypothetical protein
MTTQSGERLFAAAHRTASTEIASEPSLANAHTGQRTEQAVKGVGIRLTGLGEVTHFVPENIGDPQARSRTKYSAATIGQCHLYECRVQGLMTNTRAGLSHRDTSVFRRKDTLAMQNSQ